MIVESLTKDNSGAACLGTVTAVGAMIVPP